jgi:hypothetical protein
MQPGNCIVFGLIAFGYAYIPLRSKESKRSIPFPPLKAFVKREYPTIYKV